MTIEKINETLDAWNASLSKQQKKHIHYNTMRNFAFHCTEIASLEIYDKFILLFTQYINEVKNNDFSYNAVNSKTLAGKYFYPLRGYYLRYLQFRPLITIGDVFLWGIICDVSMWFADYNSDFYFGPYITLALLIYYFYLRLFKIPKRRVYGLFY
jgi:hypothetical protein